MKYIKTNWDVPYYNFALESYLLKQAPEDEYVFFYIHAPSIIIGKHQNALEEINQEYVVQNNIVVARRLSGGGAVYHDEGNLNFSFVKPTLASDMTNFEKFTRPVIETLNKLGVQAELSGRNDILVEGKKISGNAQFYTNGRLLSHGTLLFNANLAVLSQALNVKPLKIQSKGIRSVVSRVANISEYLTESMSIYQLKEAIIDHLAESLHIDEYVLSEEEMMHIEKSAKEHFSSWEWNYGKTPRFELQKIDKFECGVIDVRLNVNRGIIESLKIYGDFFALQELDIIEQALQGCPYRKDAISQVIDDALVQATFKAMSAEEFINLLIEE
jgi:lipoate---protein ligase